MTEITYREATRDDAKGISSLILESQEEFSFHEYTEEGKKVMLQLCGAKVIQSYVEHGDIYWVALHENQLIGVAGVRDKNHLSHNFVAKSWHRRGISSRLWELVSQECIRRGNDGSFELNASTYAIPVPIAAGSRRDPGRDNAFYEATPVEPSVHFSPKNGRALLEYHCILGAAYTLRTQAGSMRASGFAGSSNAQSSGFAVWADERLASGRVSSRPLVECAGNRPLVVRIHAVHRELGIRILGARARHRLAWQRHPCGVRRRVVLCHFLRRMVTHHAARKPFRDHPTIRAGGYQLLPGDPVHTALPQTIDCRRCRWDRG